MELRVALDAAEAVLSEAEASLRAQAESVEQADAIERLNRVVLYQKMIRNVRMNVLAERFGNVTLRVNQLRAVSALVDFLKNECNGGDRGSFKQPTGAGKTVLFGIIAKLIDVKTLILVPRQNLLTNTFKELKDQVGFNPADIGLVGGGDYELGRKVTIATYQSHVLRMQEDTEYRTQMKACELIICDEAHRSLGAKTANSIDALDEVEPEEREHLAEEVSEDQESDDELTFEEELLEQEALGKLAALTNATSLKLAFTATPVLANKHVIHSFKYLIAEEKQGELVKAGILVPYRIVQVDGSVHVDDFDKYMTEEEEAGILERENVYGKLASAYADSLTRYREKQSEEIGVMPLRGVAFCVNHAECEKFELAARQQGLRTRIVTAREAKGKKGNDVIEDAERQLLEGEIDMIITIAKLGEGWNFKPANAAIWARASTSPMTVIQGVGRTSRSYVDAQGRVKPYSLVFETNWSLRGLEGGRNAGRQPLSIADALSLNGENAAEICSMENGKPLEFHRKFELDENGMVDVDGTVFVDPYAYIQHKFPRLTRNNASTLRWRGNRPWDYRHPSAYFRDAQGNRQPAYITRNGRVVDYCDYQTTIDNLLKGILIIGEDGIIQPSAENGLQAEAVGLHSYLAHQGKNVKKWIRIIAREANPVNMRNVRVMELREHAKSQRLEEVWVFDRAQVDAILANKNFILEASAERLEISYEQMEKGFELEDEAGVKGIAVHLNHFPFPSGSETGVREKINDGTISPVQKWIVAPDGRRRHFYWKHDLEKLLLAIDQGKKAKADEKAQAKQRVRDEKYTAQRDAALQKKKLTKKDILPQAQPGLYYVDYSIPTRGKTLEGKGLAVTLTEYVPPALGKTLSLQAVLHFEQVLRNIPGYIVTDSRGRMVSLFWKEEVDALVDRLRQEARARKKE